MLDLHVNTVRPHLERMRDVGLLTVDTEARGGVGRPQHRYSLSPDAPSLGLEPSVVPDPRPIAPRCGGRRRPRRQRAHRRRSRAGRHGRREAGTDDPGPRGAHRRAGQLGLRSGGGRARVGRHDGVRPLPVPRPGRGVPGPRVRAAPRPRRRLRRRGSAATPMSVDRFHPPRRPRPLPGRAADPARTRVAVGSDPPSAASPRQRPLCSRRPT